MTRRKETFRDQNLFSETCLLILCISISFKSYKRGWILQKFYWFYVSPLRYAYMLFYLSQLQGSIGTDLMTNHITWTVHRIQLPIYDRHSSLHFHSLLITQKSFLTFFCPQHAWARLKSHIWVCWAQNHIFTRKYIFITTNNYICYKKYMLNRCR